MKKLRKIKKIQSYPENMVVDNNNQPMNIEESKNIHSNYVPVTEYEDFNANVFWNDFYHNKGERLIPNNNNQPQTNHNNDEMIEETMNFMNPIETELNPTLDEGNFSNANEFNQNCQLTSENFSICLNGVKSNQNGGYQATIQGNFLNKPLTGTVMLFFDQNEGTFKGTFNGSIN